MAPAKRTAPFSEKPGRGKYPRQKKRKTDGSNVSTEQTDEDSSMIVDNNEAEAPNADEISGAIIQQQEQPKEDSKWYKMLSDETCAGVILVASDGTEIRAHRFVLHAHSKVLDDRIVAANENPARVNIEESDADVIRAALEFLYDKPESINGKEREVFKFAETYEINDIMIACATQFEATVDVSNVLDIVKIADSHQFESLKVKCLHIIDQQSKQLNPEEIVNLPRNLLINLFSL